MVQKVRLVISVATVLCLFSCKQSKEKVSKTFSFFVSSNSIPKDTINLNDARLKLDNGFYFFEKRLFSGYIKENYPENNLRKIGSYLNGQSHGITKIYYVNGKLQDKRSYKNGKTYGLQIGFWENGKQRYEYIYNDEKREGIQKQWYENGNPYCSLTFKDDKEDGMQKAWRENGKQYINYQVRNGKRYGLQKSNLCYTLIDQKLKKNEN